MKGTTHAITGALITATILPLTTTSDVGIALAVGAIGALIPDIDISTSKITHYITNTKINSPVIQTILKISVLNIIGLVTSIYLTNNFYPLLLSIFLSMISLTKHRTLSHSLISSTIIIGLLNIITTNKLVVYSIGIGYLVHLIEDMLNITGVPLLYPIYTRNQKVPIITNDTSECIFKIIVIVLCLINIFEKYLNI